MGQLEIYLSPFTFGLKTTITSYIICYLNYHPSPINLPMDLLRQEILKKRQSLSEESGGKKFYKRSEIEQKKLQKLREEERREHELKAQRRAAAAAADNGGKSSISSSATAMADSKPSASDAADSKSLTDEKNIETLTLPRQEVVRRLRILKQPVTLFGEDDQARLDRLKYVLKEGLFEVEQYRAAGYHQLDDLIVRRL